MSIYQYKREPLTSENADRLSNACRTGIEKVVIATLLDTGLRVSELAGLTKEASSGRTAGSWFTARAGRSAKRPSAA